MEENGSCLPPQIRIPLSVSRAILVGIYRLWPPACKAKLPWNATHLLTLATVVALFLGNFQSTAASSTSLSSTCPGECQCSTLTAAQSSISLFIDCSNGGLPSLPINMSQSVIENVIAQINQALQSEGNSSDTVSPQPVGKNHTLFLAPTTGRNETTNEGNRNPGRNELLVELDLSFNNISSHQLQYLFSREASPTLQRLNLSNNRIETLENTSLLLLDHLVSLDLSHNRIHLFSPKVFQKYFPALQYLFLNGNDIVRVHSRAINPDPPHKPHPPPLPALAHLDLSHNQLEELPARAFSSFPMLKSLNLSQNSIHKISHFAFAELPQLESLYLSQNSFSSLDYPVFQNTSLVRLSLADLPYLTAVYHDVFKGLTQLQYLNLSQNTRLEFLHPNILSHLKSLEVLDISGSGIQQLSPITFHKNLHLKYVYLKDIPLFCHCTNAWLAEQLHRNGSIFHDVSTLQCTRENDNKTLSLADALFPCQEVALHNMTQQVSVSIGSMLMLRCKQASSAKGEEILTWETPRGRKFYLHDFHPNASQHLLSDKDVKLDSPFHENHPWHKSNSYYSDLDSFEDRILILSDGSLFIDYILRSDAGPYTCRVHNAYYNSSGTTVVRLRYTISTEIKIYACLVGILCALAFFTLNLLYVIISWLARRLVNKRRREHIRQMLENLNNYKSTQIARIHENYTYQLNRVRNRYHNQRDRLHRNYTMQVDRVKRGCSHQVEKVRENYNSKLNHLREYSSNQIVQIRDIANTQIGRIRDYGSLQLDRLRETYKLQQQHVLKLLDTMNLDNCRSIVETECMRTESMMYDLDLLSQEDERTESPFSMGESEYNTAASSPIMSTDLKENVQDNDMYQLPHTLEGDDIISAENDTNARLTEIQEGDQFPLPSLVPDPENLPQSHTLCRTNDIEIEMNTSLALDDNLQLESKEVWAHENREKTLKLYTRINQPGKASRIFQTDPPHENIENNQQCVAQGVANTGEAAQEEILAAVTLPSIDLNSSQSLVDPSENGTNGSPFWEGSSIKRAESPTKTWPKSPSFFPEENINEVNEDTTTVHLYDADLEDEFEENSESDTMV